MNTELVVALISLAGSAIGSVVGITINARLTSYRLEQLEKKVNQHNNLIDRMYKVEEATEVHDEKFKVINHRIADLEGYHKPD